MKFKNNKSGITLVALIVTIIILLILAGISISVLTKQGLFVRAQEAKNRTENAQIEEIAKLSDYENKMVEYVDGTRDTITISMEEYNRLKNSTIYSEDEIDIGTWIDGKKLYRKTYEFSSIGTYTANLDNPETVSIRGIVIDKNNDLYNIPYYNSGDYFITCFYHRENDSIIMKAADNNLISKVYIIIEYTKTTDN